MAFADVHSTKKNDGRVFPSRDRLMAFTKLSKNTIPAAKKALIDRGQLIDTAERRGQSGRIEVYRLGMDVEADGPNDGQSDGPQFDRDSPQFDQDGPHFGSQWPKSRTQNWDRNASMNGGKGTKTSGLQNNMMQALLEGRER